MVIEVYRLKERPHKFFMQSGDTFLIPDNCRVIVNLLDGYKEYYTMCKGDTFTAPKMVGVWIKYDDEN